MPAFPEEAYADGTQTTPEGQGVLIPGRPVCPGLRNQTREGQSQESGAFTQVGVWGETTEFKYLKRYLKEEETGFILQTVKLQPMYRSHKKLDVIAT